MAAAVEVLVPAAAAGFAAAVVEVRGPTLRGKSRSDANFGCCSSWWLLAANGPA